MKPNAFILIGILLVLGTSIFFVNKTNARPNVLMIIVDDMNEWLSFLDPEIEAKTPNLDKLAAESCVFRNAHTAATLCNPSRMAVMTGIEPANSGIYQNKQLHHKLPKTEIIFNSFKNAGYGIYSSGKVFHTEDQDLEIDWDDRFFTKETSQPYKFGWGVFKRDESIMDDVLASQWVENLLHKNHQKPFFISLGINKPHAQWLVPQKYYDMYPIESIRLPTNPKRDLDDVPVYANTKFAHGVSFFRHAKKEKLLDDAIQGYLASVSFADARIGEVLETLNSSKYSKNTIVVFWSDHGFHLATKSRFRKQTLWNETTHVPLLIKVPGIKAKLIDSLAGLIDIFPTLSDLCGLEPKNDLDGRSLKTLMEGDSSWDRHLVTSLDEENHSVLYGKWRYTHYADNSAELYNHAEDPFELKNLILDPKYTDIIENMAARLPVPKS